MSFMDKAREKFDELKERFDAPEKPGVGEEDPTDAGAAVRTEDDPALGTDPDLDLSREDQYDAD
ncbi:hypothetical protein ACTXJR_07975 [Glutamicibacter ardleyensis]|uniref:hypothetical protein n=2 Tax=Glutamicibacter ardleyensis TaxID=225894 RepID=UPI003FD181BF